MSILTRAKRWMLIVAAAFATWQGAWGIVTARRESGPTALSAATFATDYRGQQWLSLTGSADVAHAFTQTDGRGTVSLWVPLVAPDAAAGSPVHVLMMFGPVSAAEARRYLDLLPTAAGPFVGSQVKYDPDSLFPDLPKAPPVVMVQIGNRPMTGGTATGVTVVFGAIFVAVLALEARALRRS